MGVTRSDLFTDEQNRIAQVAKGLGHPARIAIIQYLIKVNACINGDLVNELGLAQATISQHLRELKELDIIQGTIEGTRISYCINQDQLKTIQKEFNTLFDTASKGDNCC
jgi:DNA-binding transcriptional ArsR family regulator